MWDVRVLLLVGITSLAGYLLGRRLGLSCGALGAAGRATLEAVGAGVIFLAANLTLMTLAIVLARVVTGRFVSFYVMDDLALAAISFLQGVLFRWWWGRG